MGGDTHIVYSPLLTLAMLVVGLLTYRRPSFYNSLTSKEHVAVRISLAVPMMSILAYQDGPAIITLIIFSKKWIFDDNHLIQNSPQKLNYSIFFSWLAFYASGNHPEVSSYCLSCGAIFYDNFHPFSPVISVIKMTYPILVNWLFVNLKIFEKDNFSKMK